MLVNDSLARQQLRRLAHTRFVSPLQRRDRCFTERAVFAQHPVHRRFTLETHIGQQGECAAEPRQRLAILEKIGRDARFTVNLRCKQISVFEQSTEFVLGDLEQLAYLCKSEPLV